MNALNGNKKAQSGSYAYAIFYIQLTFMLLNVLHLLSKSNRLQVQSRTTGST